MSFLFFFLHGGKVHDLARVTKNLHIFEGPYFDPITPPVPFHRVGVTSQNRTSTHLGKAPGQVPAVLPLRFGVCTCSTPSDYKIR